MAKAKSQSPARVSLADFARTKRQPPNPCRICALPEPIRSELDGAEGIRWPVRVEWLQQAHGITITLAEARVHAGGAHATRYHRSADTA